MACRTFVLLFLLVGAVFAQLDTGLTSLIRRVRVHVAFMAGGSCDASTQVAVIGRKGTVAQGFTNNECVAEFSNIPAGEYHVIVSGRAFPSTDTDHVAIDSSDTRDIEVKVQLGGQPGEAGGAQAGSFVAAVDLGIPANAAKEFDKATALIANQNWTKALERLNRAIAIYPAYTAAYNNLGVVYARVGDRAREREVLQRAIRINDHFAPAYVNLARMSIAAGDFRDAVTQLNKANAFDPSDAMTLVLLTYVEFMEQQLDEAIVTSRKAHSMQQPHASVHWVAARAFEQKHQAGDAITELRMFLNEEQTGLRAEAARKELAALQAASH
jgi:flagellin-specific chaperone FliS